MATNPDVQRAMLHLATILTTAYEFDNGLTATPQGPMFLAFQQMGYDIDHFTLLISAGEKLGYWKATSTIICLTELGIEKAKHLKELTEREKQ